jgi:CRP-like cAMP-binding protein
MLLMESQSAQVPASAEIKPVSYIWLKLLRENSLPLDGTLVEVAPGYEKKIGDALALLGFKGTIFLVEPDAEAARHVQRLYRLLMPQATVNIVTKPLQQVVIGTDLPLHVDALLANHPFDDMAIYFAMREKKGSLFTQEKESGEGQAPAVQKLYAAVSDRDYIHGILATMLVWKNFVRKLRPALLVVSQYPSRKLALKKLTKRQNSGLIALDRLKSYYQAHVKDFYRDSSFGQKGDPAWWLIAKKPYTDLPEDLAEPPAAIERLEASIFAPQKARRLDPADFDVVYADPKYFEAAGYGADAWRQARDFAIVLDNEGRGPGPKITVYADRQKDATNIALSGNVGSGRAVYYGKRFNINGVGKTTLCTSASPSHSTGSLEIIGALRRVVLSRWINHFTPSAVQHPAVLALKQVVKYKWNPEPVPLALLVRVDDGALDRPSHVEQAPSLALDFPKTLAAYARLDAHYFAYRLMLGAWSTGNYSLDGRIIDLETASFVKYRGPYGTASRKHHECFFGHEGAAFIKILRQLADAKGLAGAEVEKQFYEERRRQLARDFLALLGVDAVKAAAFFSKRPARVVVLADRFEKLAKKIAPWRTSLDLYGPVPDAEDPSLLDFSKLFRNLAKLRAAPGRETKALERLVRPTAFARVKPGASYDVSADADGKVNPGEVFIRDTAVVTFSGLKSFRAETKGFVRGLFRLLDNLDSAKCLPPRSQWDDQLRALNQDFPVMHELNDKLRYWVEEYRSGRISSEVLGAEIEKLCRLPHYPTGESLDLAGLPLLEYARPTRREARFLSRRLQVVSFQKGETIVREGAEADALFLLVQGVCRVAVRGVEIGRIDDRGALIGEAVVFERGRKRSASVMAETEVRLLRILRADLREMKTAYPRLRKLLANLLIQRREGISDKIRDLEVFSGADPEGVRLFLADKGRLRRFGRGARLVRQGEKTKGVYLLLRGSVVLSQTKKLARTEPIDLVDRPLTQGLFGERSVILGEGATCVVKAQEPVLALYVGQKDFRALLDRYPQLLRNCLENISDYLRANENRASMISKLEQELNDPGA